jgi:replicative DNA helicase
MSADTLSVGDEVKRKKLLDAIGGPAYLHGLCDGIPRNFSIKGMWPSFAGSRSAAGLSLCAN